MRRGPGGERERAARPPRPTRATLIAAARSGAEAEPREPPPRYARAAAAVAERPVPARPRGTTRCCAAVLAGELSTGQVITALQDSGLRGMGGAGFPTGRKWDLVAAQPATPKYVICNADESEPGTFKDRQILAEQPHLVLEGMLLGMLAIGAEEGWVFIRHEYGPEEAVIRREIESLRSAGLVGADVARPRAAAVGGGVHLAGWLHPRRGVGADRVHGGAPRRAAQQAAVPRRLRPARPAHADELGGDVRARAGHRQPRRRVVAGPGRRGQHRAEVLRGLRPRRAAWRVLRADGHAPCASCWTWPAACPAAGGWAPSSPAARRPTSSGPDQLDIPLDFGPLRDAGTMLGSGALVVMAEGTDLLAAATNVLRFFRDESCGKCVPCRVGSTKAHRILTSLLAAGGGPADVDGQITELEQVMRRTSICGLGQVALGPVLSVTRLSER